MIVADTSGLLALFNRREPAHEAANEVVMNEPEPLVVSPYVIAELDYLMATRMGTTVEKQVLDELAGGAYHMACFDAAELAAGARIVEQYSDQAIGLADASLVVLAGRFKTRSLLTLDHRHFDVVRPMDGGRFRLLPLAWSSESPSGN